METKFTRKLTDLEAVWLNFRDSLTLEPSLFPELVADNIKSGQIQKFEFTVELLWKTVQVFLLEVDGVDVVTPKSVAKEFLSSSNLPLVHKIVIPETILIGNPVSNR